MNESPARAHSEPGSSYTPTYSYIYFPHSIRLKVAYSSLPSRHCSGPLCSTAGPVCVSTNRDFALLESAVSVGSLHKLGSPISRNSLNSRVLTYGLLDEIKTGLLT